MGFLWLQAKESASTVPLQERVRIAVPNMLNLPKTVLYENGSPISRKTMGTAKEVGSPPDAGGKDFFPVLRRRSVNMFDHHAPSTNDAVPRTGTSGCIESVKESPLGHYRPGTARLRLDLKESMAKKVLEVR